MKNNVTFHAKQTQYRRPTKDCTKKKRGTDTICPFKSISRYGFNIDDITLKDIFFFQKQRCNCDLHNTYPCNAFPRYGINIAE